MQKMLGICYDGGNKMWLVCNLTMCDCGGHVCKDVIRGDTAENILKELKGMMERIKPTEAEFPEHNNNFKTKLENVYKSCNDKRVNEIQTMIGELLEVINNGKTTI